MINPALAGKAALITGANHGIGGVAHILSYFGGLIMFTKIAKGFLGIALFAFALNCIAAILFLAEAQEASLSAVVFFGFPSAKELKQNCHPKADTCLGKYLECIAKNSFLMSDHFPATPETLVKYKRRNLEEQIVVLMGNKTRDEAKVFSLALPLYAEWEGMSECPLTEADFVEQWLNKYPHAQIAPFLHLFRAHRLRAAFEAAQAGHEKGLWPILSARYKESLQKALSSDNFLISCIAHDLEEKPYVYLEGYGRP
jgi:hypothetical protein